MPCWMGIRSSCMGHCCRFGRGDHGPPRRPPRHRGEGVAVFLEVAVEGMAAVWSMLSQDHAMDEANKKAAAAHRAWFDYYKETSPLYRVAPRCSWCGTPAAKRDTDGACAGCGGPK